MGYGLEDRVRNKMNSGGHKLVFGSFTVPGNTGNSKFVCSLLHCSSGNMQVCFKVFKKWISAFSEAGTVSRGIAALHF